MRNFLSPPPLWGGGIIGSPRLPDGFCGKAFLVDTTAPPSSFPGASCSGRSQGLHCFPRASLKCRSFLLLGIHTRVSLSGDRGGSGGGFLCGSAASHPQSLAFYLHAWICFVKSCNGCWRLPPHTTLPRHRLLKLLHASFSQWMFGRQKSSSMSSFFVMKLVFRIHSWYFFPSPKLAQTLDALL